MLESGPTTGPTIYKQTVREAKTVRSISKKEVKIKVKLKFEQETY